MMVMENDEFKIPEQYRKMSVTQLDNEAEKLLKELKQAEKNIRRKKKASQGQKEITFHI